MSQMCLQNALEKFPEADREDMKALFDRMTAIRQKGFLDSAGDPNSNFMLKAKELLNSYRRGVMISQARALRDQMTMQRAEAFARNPAFTGSTLRNLSGKMEGLVSYLTGTHKLVENGRLHFDSIRGEAVNEQLSKFFQLLDKTTGSEAVLRSGEKDFEIGQARWNLAHGKELPADIDPHVKAIAEAWQAVGDLQLQRSNEAGAYVSRREGHMMIRSYDPLKVEEMGKDGFIEFMLDRVDFERSFQRDFYSLDPKKVLSEMYDNIVGRHFDIPEVARPNDSITVVGAPANLARTMEKARTIEFKDWKSEHEFMQELSRNKTIAEAINHSVRENSRRTALLQLLGSNPEENLKRLMAKLDLSTSEKSVVMRHWNALSGKADVHGDDPVSKWLASARRITDMGSLGYSTLRNFPDLTTIAATLQMGEKNFFEMQSAVIEGAIKNLSGDQRKELMKLVGAGADAMVGSFFDRNGVTTGGHAWVSNVHEKFMRLIGQKGWTDVIEAGAAHALSVGLGEKSALEFSQLNPAYARVLQKYGIGPVEWNLIRASAVPMEEGFSLVGANGIREMPLPMVREIIGKDAGDALLFQRRTAQKLGAFFKDRIDIGMNRAGTAEKASFLNRGFAENTMEGQMFRFFSHFKSYSFTMSNKFTPSFYYENLAGQGKMGAAAAVAPVLVSLTAMGYLGQVAWDIAHNRTPSDPRSPKVALDAMVRGGAGGVYGDFILGSWDSRHGREALSYLAGPEIGKTSDLMDLVSQFKDAGLERDASKIRASAITRFVTNIFPGNMPVVRQGMDYLFLNHMVEAMNPGYNERMKSRLSKQGQEQLFGNNPPDIWE